jgi:hypothetical protein
MSNKASDQDLQLISELKLNASKEELSQVCKEDFETNEGWDQFQREYSFAKVYYLGSKTRLV